MHRQFLEYLTMLDLFVIGLSIGLVFGVWAVIGDAILATFSE